MSYKTLNSSNYPKLQLSQIGKQINSSALYGWGSNAAGQLGNLTYGQTYTNPVKIAAPIGWKSIALNQGSSFAIQSNGTLWAWGNNFEGEFGNNTTASKSEPIQVNSSNTWTQISVGTQHTLALQSNGTLWVCGDPSLGRLGLSDTTYRISITQLGNLSNWSQISAGTQYSLALQSNGTLWAWGYNSLGTLGTGDGTNRSSPTQIGSASTWTKICPASNDHIVAIQSNGTLWAWGYESFGQLGNNTTTNQFQYTPIQIGNVSTWTQVTSGHLFSAALQSNGTLWAWGYNAYGELGLGDRTDRSSPVQVGNLSNWSKIFGGGQTDALFALQSNGTLWACGYNSQGQLGLGDLTNRSSLTQVGTLSIWTQIATGYQQNIAIATQYF
jgi:alpha-tubulin suppressor-like RCC1 family protein